MSDCPCCGVDCSCIPDEVLATIVAATGGCNPDSLGLEATLVKSVGLWSGVMPAIGTLTMACLSTDPPVVNLSIDGCPSGNQTRQAEFTCNPFFAEFPAFTVGSFDLACSPCHFNSGSFTIQVTEPA